MNSGPNKTKLNKLQNTCQGSREKAIRQIFQLLSSDYPEASSRLLEPAKGNPVDVLVATILSQATNDTLSSRAFSQLKRRFPNWERILTENPSEVEKVLACGGLHREKTKKIRKALDKIRTDFGQITLDPLRKLSRNEAYKYLTSLPGVGPKTAACVLAFGLGKPAFPVDTHVLRICRRVGLVPPKASALRTQENMEQMVPDNIKIPLHLMLIEHGRRVCHSKKPRCEDCLLRNICFLAKSEGILTNTKN